MHQGGILFAPKPLLHQPYPHRYEPPLTPPNSTPGSSPEEEHGRQASSARVPPVAIPKATKVVNGFTISMQHPLETPPTTPENVHPVSAQDWATKDLEFLADVFPDDVAKALPYATSVSIAQDDMTWEGFVLALPRQPKTLYVCGRGAERVQLRESIVALLDLADEHLGCSAFVIALEKRSPALAGLIHSLMYVSGQVVSRPPFEVDDKYVLVGIEI